MHRQNYYIKLLLVLATQTYLSSQRIHFSGNLFVDIFSAFEK